MKRLRKAIAVVLAITLILAGFGLATFEVVVVKPIVARAHSVLSGASPSERNPSLELRGMLRADYGDRLNYFVARNLLVLAPSQVEGMRTPKRQLTELLTGLLLQLHLDQSELDSVYLASAYMGPGVHGFGSAGAKYLSKDIANLSRVEAAKLVVIARAPSYMLADPVRLERLTQVLLSRNQ